MSFNASRILVLGSPGSGKTSFSVKLAQHLNLPLFHLDDFFWQRKWEAFSEAEYLSNVQKIMRRPSWIMDGNHRASLSPRLRNADTVILIKAPKLKRFLRVVRRGLSECAAARFKYRPFHDTKGFLNQVWNFDELELPQILDDIQSVRSLNENITLSSLSEISNFLKALPASSAINLRPTPLVDILFRTGVWKDKGTPEEKFINQNGIVSYLDLRTPKELSERPMQEFVSSTKCSYSSIPLNQESLPFFNIADPKPGDYASLYIQSLKENANSLKEIFLALGNGRLQFPLLVGCSAGKDRTGILVALLLDLFGIARSSIIEDYVESGFYLTAHCDFFANSSHRDYTKAEILRRLKPSAESMDTFLKHLYSEHGGARAYLKSLGLTAAEIQAITRGHPVERSK